MQINQFMKRLSVLEQPYLCYYTMFYFESAGYSPAMKKVSRVACNVVFKKLWIEFKYVYTNPYTLTWSIWYAICLCGYNQEGTYAQTLWQDLHRNHTLIQHSHMNGTLWQNAEESLLLYDPLKYTGFTEVAHTIFGKSYIIYTVNK